MKRGRKPGYRLQTTHDGYAVYRATWHYGAKLKKHSEANRRVRICLPESMCPVAPGELFAAKREGDLLIIRPVNLEVLK